MEDSKQQSTVGNDSFELEEADIRSRLAAVVESCDDAIISKNLDGIIRTWNKGAERIFGYKAEEIVGKPILTLIPPERHYEEDEILSRLGKGERIEHYETVRVKKNGELIDVSLTSSPVKDKNGRIVGASKIARDISQKKRIEAEREALLISERDARTQAEHASIMKDEFLANLSHELRTPLNAILGWAQLLCSKKQLSEDVKQGLSVIEKNTRIQTRLIEDLLDMSRIISGKLRLEVQDVDLEEVILTALSSVQHSADAKGIFLESNIDTVKGPIRGDPNRIQQCLWNFLNNAIKFTPQSGKILVILRSVDSGVEISVTDTGPGIGSEFLPHVFDRFRQADASSIRRYGGLGLELAITKNLVELHGGKVSAKSEGEGLGSTFSIELPIKAACISTTYPYKNILLSKEIELPSVNHPSLIGIKVLALDDVEDATDIIKRILEQCGAEVFTSSSVAEAIRLIETEHPNLILSDIGMPEEDGYSFIKKVRALSPEKGGRTPAVAVTAFARAEDRTKVLRAGYQSYITKPIEAAELTAMVASLATR